MVNERGNGMRGMIGLFLISFLIGCGGGTKESTADGTRRDTGAGDATVMTTGSAGAEQDANAPVTWSIEGSTVYSAAPGGVVNVRLRAVVAPDVRLYTDREYGGLDFTPVPTTVELKPQEIFASAGDMVADQGSVQKIDPHFGEQQLEYWVGTVTISVPITLSTGAVAGKSYDASVQINYMSCTDEVCHTPKTAVLPVTIRVTGR